MQPSLFRFLLLPAIAIAFSGCNRARDVADPSPFAAQTADASTPAGAFSARMAQLDKSGDFQSMVAAAQVRLASDANDQSARYALALGSFYNGDFVLAAKEWETLTATPAYSQNAEVLEFLHVAQFLSGKYAGQRFQPVQSVPGDVAALSDQWRAQGAALIAAKKYDEIEKVAAQQTQNPTIMSDGGWTLAPFYVGLWGGTTDSKTDAQWQTNHAQIEAWHAARPNSQLARICLARSWTNGAWTARGSEFANKVSRQAWQTVEERQQKAAPIYQKLLSEKVTTPLLYAAAQRFGRLGGAPRSWHDEIFARAIAQFPAYTDFYRERAIYLLPRWGGAPGEWEQDLQKSADAEQVRAGAVAGDQLYARVVWGQTEFYGTMAAPQKTDLPHTGRQSRRMARYAQIDWPRTQRGFDSILAQNPNSLSAATIYMRLRYQHGESTKARELLQIVGGRAETKAWESPRDFAEARINILRLLP
ncbi:MAG: DUF4034 domain-containing protein [Armatimonadetes bacterium]|nr:DUF4034 domain-containing protein [Armatimonadota bacterium]